MSKNFLIIIVFHLLDLISLVMDYNLSVLGGIDDLGLRTHCSYPDELSDYYCVAFGRGPEEFG
jgi:hypothetical protein